MDISIADYEDVNQTELAWDYYLCDYVEVLGCLSQSQVLCEKLVAIFEDYENSAE